MFFTDAGSATCSSAVEYLLFLSGKFIMMGGCSSMLRLYLPLSRPVWFLCLAPEVLLWCRACLTQAPVFIVCLCRNQASQDGCDCRHEAFHYYECDYHWDDSCHFLLTGLCRCKNELGLRLVGLQFDLLSSVVSKPEFLRVGLIDTDKFVGGDLNLTTKVTFLSTYPFPWLVAWSVFSWVSVTP